MTHFIRYLRTLLAGKRLTRAIHRYDQAAEDLDRTVRELLSK